MYQVPQNITTPKIFIVQRSETESRLDSHYNMPEYRELFGTLESSGCKLSSLRQESITIFSGTTPKSGGEAYCSVSNAIPFVRSGDFSDTNQIDFSETLHIKPEIHNGIMSASKLRKNDLLVAIVGATIGKIGVYQYDKEANINQAICAVRLKRSINPLYVQAFYQTNIGQKIIERVKRPVARANLNIEEVGALPIPLVDDKTQQKVVDTLQIGINEKLRKESEAQQLLDSIDTYILDELGISLPVIRTDLDSRIFVVNRRMFEDRFDPKFNKDIAYIRDLSCVYPWISLDDVTIDNGQYGANEKAKDYQKGDVRYIRITDIGELGNLKESDMKTAEYIDSSYMLHKDDILFARSGSVGRCYIHKDMTAPAIFAGYLIRFVLNTNRINADYLFYYCNSKLYKYWVNTIQRPAVQANINAQEFRSMPIPLPPLAKQQEIADHISNLRQRAKGLQAEGNQILENAKKEVEQMIIG